MRLLKSRVLFRWLPLFYSLILLFLRTLQNSKCSKILSWTVFFFFLTSFQGTLSLLPHTEQQQRTKFVLLDITRFFSDALKPIRRSLMRKTSDTQGVWNQWVHECGKWKHSLLFYLTPHRGWRHTCQAAPPCSMSYGVAGLCFNLCVQWCMLKWFLFSRKTIHPSSKAPVC